MKPDISNYNVISEDRGNIIASLKKGSNSDIYIMWHGTERVKFDEYKNDKPEEAVVRVMIKPGGCDIQFRANQALPRFSNNKPKNLAACAFFSKADLEYILKQIIEKKY